MNCFLIRLLAVCFFLAVVCPIIGAAAGDNNTTSAVASVVEIRGPVYDGSDLSAILSNTAYGDGITITMDANNFATFYYDTNLTLTNVTLANGTLTNVTFANETLPLK